MKVNAAASTGSFILEVVKIVVISLAIIIPVRYFLVQPFFVKGESMAPNFSDGDYLLVNEIGPRISDLERGDVVIFKYPKDPSQYFIKRVIGLPGERVLVEQNRVYIYNKDFPQGTLLEEGTYLPFGQVTPGETDVALSTGEYFVLGDNRRASSDSRTWGILRRDEIIGKAWVRLWPVSSASRFPAPAYSTLNQ